MRKDHLCLLTQFYERFVTQLVDNSKYEESPQVSLEFLQDEALILSVSQQTNRLRQVHAFVQDLE